MNVARPIFRRGSGPNFQDGLELCERELQLSTKPSATGFPTELSGQGWWILTSVKPCSSDSIAAVESCRVNSGLPTKRENANAYTENNDRRRPRPIISLRRRQPLYHSLQLFLGRSQPDHRTPCRILARHRVLARHRGHLRCRRLWRLSSCFRSARRRDNDVCQVL